jgi:hypothetical protein
MGRFASVSRGNLLDTIFFDNCTIPVKGTPVKNRYIVGWSSDYSFSS